MNNVNESIAIQRMHQNEIETDKIKIIEELKALLNSSDSFLNLLCESERLTEKERKYIEIIQASNKDIMMAINRYAESEPSDNPSRQEISTDNKKNILKKSILVAESDDNQYHLIRCFFEESKFELIRAASGEEAVAIAGGRDVDIILMDLKLPVIDGFRATENILKKKPGSIIIAQSAFPADKERASSSGCIDFIAKPYKKHQLVSMINSYIQPIIQN